ncbi:MAG: hypothetical protein MHM6MM_003876 [Cercozoa sp. M6MM]
MVRPPVRTAVRAGTWYAGKSDVLRAQLRQWLCAADERSDASFDDVKAIIVPHAGYRFCGETAAYAYRHLRKQSHIKRVVVLGPSHRVATRKLLLSSSAALATPLGDLPVDTHTVEQLSLSPHCVLCPPKAEEEEHSIEMCLPYLREVLHDDVTLVPIIVGQLRRDDIKSIGELLRPLMLDSGTVFVLSSDFCHWGERFRFQWHDEVRFGRDIWRSIQHLDQSTMQAIEQGADALLNHYEETGNTVCGRYGISAALASVANASTAWHWANYSQSNRCRTMRDSSVSYTAGVMRMSPN